MHIEQRMVGDIAIVEVTGNLVAESGDASLKDKVRSLIQQGVMQIVVDLGNVLDMDSSGLGELVKRTRPPRDPAEDRS